MKTYEELIKEGKKSPHTQARYLYDYFVKREGDIVASYEIDRVNLVAMTLERDEFDEANKKLVAKIKELEDSRKYWHNESLKQMELVAELREEIKRLQSII
jgi:hypothetical protein